MARLLLSVYPERPTRAFACGGLACLEAADLPGADPHSFPNVLVELGSEVCSSPAAFKAWSMNLGYDSVLTNVSTCCNISVSIQRDLMKRMWQ